MRKLFAALKEEEIERIRESLLGQGYSILTHPPHDHDHDAPFDILAQKDTHTIAYVVLIRAQNGESIQHISRVRKLAHERGYDFRVAFVHPPHEKTISVEGLDRVLFEYLARLPEKHYADFPGHISISAVDGIQVDSLIAQPNTMVVMGSGIVDATLVVPHQEPLEPATYQVDAPLYFTVTLSHGLEVQEEGTSIRIDTSEYLPEKST